MRTASQIGSTPDPDAPAGDGGRWARLLRMPAVWIILAGLLATAGWDVWLLVKALSLARGVLG